MWGGFPAEMGFWSGVEPVCLGMWKALVFELVQGTNPASSFVESCLALSFLVMTVEGVVAMLPFVLAVCPNDCDDCAGPRTTTVVRRLLDIVMLQVLLLELLPQQGPSTKDQLVPSNVCLACYKWFISIGKGSWRIWSLMKPVVDSVDKKVY